MKATNIALVILNYNGKAHLQKYLPSIVTHSKGCDIIIADNCSSDDSIFFLQSSYPTLRIIINDANYGFAQGYNQALAQLKGQYEYFLLVNSDIEVTENWISPLLNLMNANPNIAAVQPKILSYQRRDYFEHAGASGGLLDSDFFPFCRGRIFNKVERDSGQYDNSKEIFWASGACFMIRSESFFEMHGFDGDFFAHMEEIDLCWRLKRAGKQVWVVPSSKVFHLGGGTLNYLSPKKTYLNFRNSLFMIHKNYDGKLFLKIISRMLLDGLAATKFLVTFQLNHFLAVLKAHLSYYQSIRNLNNKRKALQIQLNERRFNDIGLYRGSILFHYFIKDDKKYCFLDKKQL